MYRIEAELLIPGHGDPIRNGVVLLDGALISYAGPAAAAPQHPVATRVTQAVTVMPGMWECHGHLIGMRTFDLGRLPLEPEALRAARCTRDLRAALDAGITSVRDVGGLGVYLARAVAEGTVDGPAIYGAGAILSTTGGHGDLHAFPLDWIEDYARKAGMLRLADGPDECAKAVREQLRRNAKLIKVCASGGVLSEVDDPIHQRERGAILVPTRTIIEDMLANKAAVPPYAMAKLEAIADIHAQAVMQAYEHGVTIAMGTDIALTGSDLPNSWGQNGSEPGYLVKLGMSPLEAIEAATATGPLTLGPLAPHSGRLAEGYDADVITLDADPLADIGVLADPGHVTAVWTRGRPVKGAPARAA
jgi:imidazolonepropionase-like amidohydrolase